LTGDPWEADDLAQETFLEAIRVESRFAGRSEVGTWLYAILLNRHRKRVRGLQRHWRRCLQWFQSFGRRQTTEPPEARLQRQEWQASLWNAVSRLSDAQRYVIVLRYCEGLSYEAIGEAIHCPVSTVRSRLHEGMKVLRRDLGGNTRPTIQGAAEADDWIGLLHGL